MSFKSNSIRGNTATSDLLGSAASALCAIHCVLTPIFFASRPIIDGIASQHSHEGHYWVAMDYVFWIISLAAVWYSARHTRNRTIQWVLWISWLVFSWGLLAHINELVFGKGFMYIGSFALIIGHMWNYRYCQKCSDEKC